MNLESKYTKEKQLIVGKNDLLTWCNEHEEIGSLLIKEWDKQKNGSMSAYKAGSGMKVYWKCSKCGKQFEKDIRSRVLGKIHGECGRKQGAENLKLYHRNSIRPEDTLAYKFPDIADEWDYEENEKSQLSPKYLSAYSSKKVAWICSKCGEHYSQHIRLRTINGYGCKKCLATREDNPRN